MLVIAIPPKDGAVNISRTDFVGQTRGTLGLFFFMGTSTRRQYGSLLVDRFWRIRCENCMEFEGLGYSLILAIDVQYDKINGLVAGVALNPNIS
jgi:hypothetical protein